MARNVWRYMQKRHGCKLTTYFNALPAGPRPDRAHNPQWFWTPLSGEGARCHGECFTRQRRVRPQSTTFFAGETPRTARLT